jgi:hypothetical protein
MSKPDYFSTLEECLASEKVRIQTNDRYKFFCQTHFTAGDVEQFEHRRNPVNGSEISDFAKPCFNNTREVFIWKKFCNLSPLCIMNTFNYLFHKFKKGVFIQIRKPNLLFLPFSKKNFVNEWSHKIRIDPAYDNVSDFIKYIYSLEDRRFNPNLVNKFFDTWYSNNCLLRFEYPIQEGDTGNPIISDMFKTLIKERNVPDVEFFVNRRDFPIIRIDGTEPYEHIYDGHIKLVSHNYDTYAPILSMVQCEGFADIPIPTTEDWSRVTRCENKFFPKTCTRDYSVGTVAWKERKSIAVFRGSSTGTGIDIDTNPRLKLAYLSTIHGNILDAGITAWNLRPRKIIHEKYLRTINIKELPFGLKSKLSLQEQQQYKYIVNVNGHVCAYRLSLELESGFCILLADSKYKLWYSNLLTPWVHYVPVKEDLSDLIKQINWCINNDKKCEKISNNAIKFAKQYLCKEAILDYLQNVLCELKSKGGNYKYNRITPSQVQYQKELDFFNRKPKTLQIYTIPNGKRTYNYLYGIQQIISRVDFEKNSTCISDIFNNNSTTVKKYTIGGYTLVRKTTSKEKCIHETFVALNQTNKLTQYSPNFVYIFGMYESNGYHVLLEHIEGKTLLEYMKTNFTLDKYLNILVQIMLSLHIAQRVCSLVHYDLTPWNIVIKEYDEPITIKYNIEKDLVYTVKTRIVPIIIDMGRSHIVHNNEHYGKINLLKCSTIQDVLTLLITSLYELSTIKNIDTDSILKIANFITGTKYHYKRFIKTGKDGLGNLRFFLQKYKKYTELICSNKYELETKTPIDLIEYLGNNFTINLNRARTNNVGDLDWRYVYEYAISKTPDKVYSKCIKRICKTDFNYDDPINTLYKIQQLGIYYKEKEVHEYLRDCYKTLTSRNMFLIQHDSPKSCLEITEDTFLFKDRIRDILNKNRDIVIDNKENMTQKVYSLLLYNGEYKAIKNMENYAYNDYSVLNMARLLSEVVYDAS